MTDPITFTFTPTRSDYIRTLRAFTLRQKSTFTIFIILVFLSLCTVIASIYQPTPIYVWFFPLALISYILFSLLIIPITVGEKVEKNERLRCATTWEVDEKTVTIRTPFSSTSFDWGTFRQACETSEHYLLVYAVNKQMFQLVPKRAFASAEQQASFRKLLEAKFRSITPIRAVHLPEPPARTLRFIYWGLLIILVLITVIYNLR
jgi:hypothetical protein